ncbi:MAG: carboxypeptidase regulatory-like domain-containing protein [Planctomycetes bacterium]|nr:carboxypeptidase regulatory-like domain-containing protein [Planctomycetota bacterium]
MAIFRVVKGQEVLEDYITADQTIGGWVEEPGGVIELPCAEAGGAHVAYVCANGYRRTRSEPFVVGGEGPHAPVVVRMDRGASISGKVSDARGAAVPSPAVEVCWAASDRPRLVSWAGLLIADQRPAACTAVTFADGRYVASGLDEGTYVLRVESPGLAAAETLPIRLAARENRTGVDVSLSPGGTIVGEVLDLGGSLAVDLPIVAVDASGWARVARTDPSGCYRMARMEAGNYWLRAGDGGDSGEAQWQPYYAPLLAASGERSPGVRVEVRANEEARCDLDLSKTHGSLRGRVTRDGFAVSAALLNLCADPTVDYAEEPYPEFMCLAQAVAETDGSFTFERLQQGRYLLVVRDPATDLPLAAEVVDLGGGDVLRTDFTLASCRLTGSVVAEEANEPLADALVFVWRRCRYQGRLLKLGLEVGNAETDRNGAFELAGLSDGTYALEVIAGEGWRERQSVVELVPGPQHQTVVRLQPAR